jgi:protein-S-isoprenylcysteine O-methyltransferase Ste14
VSDATGKDNAGVIAPPPLLFAGFLAVGFALDAMWATRALGSPGRYWIGGVAILLGALLMAAGVARFNRAGTNIPPHKPTTALVTDGPYRYSRNPLYVSLLLVYCGIGLIADNLWILGLGVPLVLVIRYGVIAREERYLERRFGRAYLDYKASVRRWL